MRLIDAEGLIQDSEDILTWEMLARINKAETIEAEQVRHERLLVTEAYPHRVYCGGCYKTLIPNEEYCYEKNQYPSYCMWCGAKLDEVSG